ncbi:enoyl-ACP reductase-like protein [Kribbella voronezhensis]|uniref:Enoyl-ACP reductase-like protein n=1 Tax=Kribbella voronezhensis TaxID=2512212 RepID=A0A4R7TD98_9ACTN|nr:SDR family NAD(P)-dependent oxidoreductase [Kribbella voronezhensis]TDU90102.1 enoyl-ACP reductase-like protein [Kribbella voronezhensis]
MRLAPGPGREYADRAVTSLVWISGASAGIGAALAASVPFPEARVVDLSRRGGTVEHFPVDLSDPAAWVGVERYFEAELAGFSGERVVFVHSAGTVVPIGPADAVDAEAYTRAVLLNSAAPQVLGRAFLRATAGLTCEKHLVMLSSGAASTAYPGWSAYNAGKAAVDHWVRTVGAEQPPLEPLGAARAEGERAGAGRAEGERAGAGRVGGERAGVARGGDGGGVEQAGGAGRIGCRVIAVAPGVVDTAMQGEIRAVDEQAFPAVGRFRELKESGALVSPEDAARGIWSLFERELPNGSVLDLRKLPD